MTTPARSIGITDRLHHVPVHVVWELTLACDLRCRTCGSRAGRRRPDELSTRECLEVVDALAALGTREVSLIGGEAYLRPDWIEIIAALRRHGIRTSMQTGARNLTPQRLDQAVAAGLATLGVSLDGLGATHDRLRGVAGSFDKAVDALRRAKAAGIDVGVNTQICAPTLPELPALLDTIAALGATHWQLQLTVAMGNAVDEPELLLQPYQLLELMPLLAELYRRGLDRGVLLMVGNNIGYFGPYEHLWRGHGDDRQHWTGCSAGHLVMGIEADGTIKGCPSLATDGFAGGNVREASLAEIWGHAPAIHFGRQRSVDDLWGFCRTCYYADVCRAGCTWTGHSLFGVAGNNPYCHHRALVLAAQGLRERVVKRRDAPDRPFAIGEFELLLERVDGQDRSRAAPPAVDPLIPAGRLVRSRADASAPGRVPARLEPCRACERYVYPNERTCPHCGADIAAAAARHAEAVAQRQRVMSTLRRHLAALGA